ncbi:MAG: NUDIX hydrolase [Chitinispirillaceae bacterium]
MEQPFVTPIIPVVVIVVEQSGQYLLVQEQKDHVRNSWCFPGGKVENNESLIEAASRETLEETGLRVNIKGLLFFDQMLCNTDSKPYCRFRYVFSASPLSGHLKGFSDEHSRGARWFHPMEIPTLKLRSPMITRMLKMHQTDSTVLPLESFQTFGTKTSG